MGAEWWQRLLQRIQAVRKEGDCQSMKSGKAQTLPLVWLATTQSGAMSISVADVLLGYRQETFAFMRHFRREDSDRITGPGVDLDMPRREIGIVFQGDNLFPHTSEIDNVTLGFIKVLQMPLKEAREKSMALLSPIGLAHKADGYPDRLWGGQQQHAAIVRPLVTDPARLLLDEITSALDPELVSGILDIVRDLAKKGMTMVLATHEMAFAREVADKVCFLQEGIV